MSVIFTVPKGKAVFIKSGKYLFSEGSKIDTADFKLPNEFTDGTALTLTSEKKEPKKYDSAKKSESDEKPAFIPDSPQDK
jgi:hypothetical protein